ncbi:hypothetical protein [Dactylosporangium sp. NPDC006015]|uniref:hypothetical protein n=1 Tax=Dactylosporangium sp. NPDC006015 TaxID=3154576 RepID=UPI0033AC86F7
MLIRVSAEDHRALCNIFIATDPRAPGRNRLRQPGARARATRAANLAHAVPVSQVTWTSAQHIAADVPERH